MIRLVTQFDLPSARPAVATPTCGCCSCCCCCCVVTLASASTYSAVTAQRILRKPRVETLERARWRSPLPGLLGFFALPTAALLVSLMLAGTDAAAGVLGLLVVLGLVWVVLLGLAYTGAGAQRPWAHAAAVVAIGLVAIVVEAFLWLALFFGVG